MIERMMTLILFLITGLMTVGLAFGLSSYFLKKSNAQVGLSKQVELVKMPSVKSRKSNLKVKKGIAAIPSNVTDATSEVGGENFDLFLEAYNYESTSRRDPFVPIRELVKTGSSDLFGPKTQTETYSLKQYRLVGIIWNVNNPKAMFEDPKNKVHNVKLNQRIGNKQGYVSAIREGEVVVVETIYKGDKPEYEAKVIKIDK